MNEMIGKTLGGCAIESKIGQGGMGTVYLAHHNTLNIPVAIKIFHTQSDTPGSKERFLREAQLMAQLRHPNIVSVMNAGIEDDIHFIIMEYIDGGNLLSLINTKKTIPVQQAVSITTDILQALKLAKENSIVHRDIKPENILIDKAGRAKLADLGLARAVDSVHLTQTNTMLGSPHYIAPEQADNSSNVDSRSDIYSLGCTLFHMLSGKEPFPGNSLIEIVMKHTRNPVPRLTEINKQIPQHISDTVFNMMQKDPDKRFSDPSAIIEALSSDHTNERTNNMIMIPKRKIPSRVAVISVVSILIILLCLTVLLSSRKKTGSGTVSMSQQDTAMVVATADTTKIPDDSTGTPSRKTPKKVKNNVRKQQIAVNSTTQSPAAAENPLIKVVKIGDTEALRTMLQKGISPECEPGSSTTPLHEAVRRGLTVETQILVKNKAPVNVLDRSGNSPLHYAVRENAQLLVKILLDGGADPNLKTKTGKTPLKMAQSIDSELESLLEKYGAK
jgi:serine/threonine protein kinase